MKLNTRIRQVTSLFALLAGSMIPALAVPMRTINTLALSALIAAGLVTPRGADAALTLTLVEAGGNVVGTGSGSINTSALTIFDTAGFSQFTLPSDGYLAYGSGEVTAYQGFSGPISFGPGVVAINPSSSSGSAFYLFASFSSPLIGLPSGYVSGTSISTAVSFDSLTFASLGVTPGTYLWTWGTDANADSFTLQIGPSAVPEPTSAALLAAGLLGLAAMRRRKTGL